MVHRRHHRPHAAGRTRRRAGQPRGRRRSRDQRRGRPRAHGGAGADRRHRSTRRCAVASLDAPGGRVTVGGREQTLRILGAAVTVEQMRNLTIPTGGGRFVKLSDVADVGDGSAEVRGFARLNGRPVVGFQVTKTKDASDVATEDGVSTAIEQLLKKHEGVSFTKIFSRSTRPAPASTPRHTLLEGMLLAALVVFLFLRDWRSTLITAVAMPVSLIPTFFVMSLLGFSLNMVTLLALTLVIGILVDDAIVEIENIEKRVLPGPASLRGRHRGRRRHRPGGGGDHLRHRRGVHAGRLHAGHSRPVLQGVRPDRLGGGAVLAAGRAPADAADGGLFPRSRSRAKNRAGAFRGLLRDVLEWALDHRIGLGHPGRRAVLRSPSRWWSLLPKGFQPEGNPDFFYVDDRGPARLDDQRHGAPSSARSTICWRRSRRPSASSPRSAQRRPSGGPGGFALQRRRSTYRNGHAASCKAAPRFARRATIRDRLRADAARRSPTRG